MVERELDLLSQMGELPPMPKALLDAGTDINYEGASGPVDFADNGDPSIATMGVYEYEANDKYVPRLDEFVTGVVPTS